MTTTWGVGQSRILALVQLFLQSNIFLQFRKHPGIFRPARQSCGYRCQNHLLWQQPARYHNHAVLWKGKGKEMKGWALKVEECIYFHYGNLIYLWKFCAFLFQTGEHLTGRHCVYITTAREGNLNHLSSKNSHYIVS